MAIECSDICKIIVAIFLPPLAVYMEKRACDKDVWINVLLTLLICQSGRVFLCVLGRERARLVPKRDDGDAHTHPQTPTTNTRNKGIPGMIHALYIIVKH